MNQTMNQEVNVLAYYFSHDSGRCFPKRIEIGGQSLDFIEGLRCLVQRGKSVLQIFNMTDGQRQYRLSFEPEQRIWKLLSMKAIS